MKEVVVRTIKNGRREEEEAKNMNKYVLEINDERKKIPHRRLTNNREFVCMC